MATVIEIEPTITVGALAEQLMIPATKLITELMKNGVLATINEKVDFDTAQIIVGELDLDIELKQHEKASIIDPVSRKTLLDSEHSTKRPPVVAVMGHVDHGKTSLLDALRDASVVKTEAGGITQHISAYQTEHKGKMITFLDTPGHEAFAALREHGAVLTDLVVIVVAADDGIKPQTLEAIRFAQKAGVKMMVAVNKIDKTGADLNRVKQQLSENGLMPEDWGGDTVIVPVSAKTKEGIENLLEMVILISEVEELKARSDGPATGLIIEAHMETGKGAVAVALVEQGSLKQGDFVVTKTTYAKAKTLTTTAGNLIKNAGPSTPVIITGFKSLPEFGQEFEVLQDEKNAKKHLQSILRSEPGQNSITELSGSDLLRRITATNEVNELNIIVKADVMGSLTSVIDSIKTLNTAEVAVRVVSNGVGNITENDIHLAATSSAIIYGFNISLPSGVKQLAARDQTKVRLYKVIYELLDDVKEELSGLLAPEVIETQLGVLTVKGIFKTTKTEIICGGEVISGKLTSPSLARIKRADEVLAEAEVTNLKRGPQDTKEVFQGDMCGLSLATASRVQLEEGDSIEFFTRTTKTRKL